MAQCLETAVASSYKFVHVMRVTLGFIVDLRDLCMLCSEQICFTCCTLVSTMVYTHRQMTNSSK